MIEILHRYTRAVLYRSESAASLAEAVKAARASGANLIGANLSGARGVASLVASALPLLRFQSGPMRALKLVTADGQGPTYRAPRPYVVGESYEEPGASTDETEQCAAGINAASPDWIWREWQPGWRVLSVEFSPEDIAAIPVGTDGKFRLHRCKVVEELPLCAVGLPRDEFLAATMIADVMVECFGTEDTKEPDDG